MSDSIHLLLMNYEKRSWRRMLYNRFSNTPRWVFTTIQWPDNTSSLSNIITNQPLNISNHITQTAFITYEFFGFSFCSTTKSHLLSFIFLKHEWTNYAQSQSATKDDKKVQITLSLFRQIKESKNIMWYDVSLKN